MVGEIGFRARDLIRAICERNRVDILKGDVGADHVHLLVSIPPSLAISKLMQQIKGKSSYLMLQEFKQLRRQYWVNIGDSICGLAAVFAAVQVM